MEEKYFIVVEAQVGSDGVAGIIPYIFADVSQSEDQRERNAKAKFFEICSVACKTKQKFHGAYYFDSEGSEFRHEGFSALNGGSSE